MLQFDQIDSIEVRFIKAFSDLNDITPRIIIHNNNVLDLGK